MCWHEMLYPVDFCHIVRFLSQLAEATCNSRFSKKQIQTILRTGNVLQMLREAGNNNFTFCSVVCMLEMWVHPCF